MHGRCDVLTAEFFAPRFDEAAKVGGKMIKAIQEEQKKR